MSRQKQQSWEDASGLDSFQEREEKIMKKLILLVAILAMVGGGSGLAIAQTMEDTSPSEAPSQQTPSNDTQSPGADNNDQSALPCDANLFRLEQQELVQFGYPTPVSERARECEQLGFENPYPAPAMLGPDGVVYPYDPIEGQYLYFDPNTGLYYVLDPATGEVSTYDPASGTFL